MRIGIDASNVRSEGGGVTHLVELLRVAQPREHGFDRVLVWGGASTLGCLENRSWLRKAHEPLLDCSLPAILSWQRFALDRMARAAGCDVLFIPSGSYNGSFKPFVTMSQNMLPFEWSEARRFGFSWWTMKFLLLRWSQSATFRRSSGLIFLTEYARSKVSPLLGGGDPRTAVIPHGVADRFWCEPRQQKTLACYTIESPFRLLYVSPIAPYKHQWHVIEAVWQLRQVRLPLKLELVGPIRNCRKRFSRALTRWDPGQEWMCYRGAIPFKELHAAYHQADAFVFASSCENLPNILLEAMAAGLPIACSNRGPMPEVLGDAGVYFDPEKPAEVGAAIRKLLEDPMLRQQKAEAAYERAKAFTWERCAHDTFEFIAQVVKESSK